MPHSCLVCLSSVVDAIKEADYIVVGPGDIYTSITPNFLVPGVKEAISSTQAKLIYISNIMTKHGETSGLYGAEIVKVVEKYLDRKFDLILANNEEVSDELRQKYQTEKAEIVRFDVTQKDQRLIFAELLSDGPLARHDVGKLQVHLEKILMS